MQLGYDEFNQPEKQVSMQKLVEKTSFCNVCAIGSLFLSYIRKYDEVTAQRVCDTGVDIIAEEVLIDIFDPANLRLMERIFEGRWIDGPELNPEFSVYAAEDISQYKGWLTFEEMGSLEYTKEQYNNELLANKYYCKYKNSNDRLRAIMLNVIRNNGEFVPPKRIR